VSIQNGVPLRELIPSESAWSRSEKNGFGPGGGSSVMARKSTASPSLSEAMRRS
jgi:hypothetical protein